MQAPAHVTSVGVFRYVDESGSEHYEYRPEAEVFAPESLATLANAVVTDLHPPVPVTTRNWAQYAKGHVDKEVKPAGKFVGTELVIQDDALIAMVESGERSEISCGYTAQLVDQSGEFEGQKYTKVQTRIRYNHVALGPSGWGRQGPEVAIRVDSKGDEVLTQEVKSMITIKIDGVDFPLGSDAEKTAAKLAFERWLAARLDADKTAVAERETLAGKVAALEKALESAKVEATKIDQKVSERLALIEAARKVLGSDYVSDGKTDREVRLAALAKAHNGADYSQRSDDFIAGAFDLAVKVNPAIKVNDAVNSAPRTDDDNDYAKNANAMDQVFLFAPKAK